MKITLEVYLGNGVRSGEDVARAIINTVSDVRFLYEMAGSGIIHDVNGNPAGNWQFEKRKGRAL